MGNTEKFEQIAHRYDTPERIAIAKISADAIRQQLIRSKQKTAIDFGCGTGLVGLQLLDQFQSIIFLDTSQAMIEKVQEKLEHSEIKHASAICFDIEQEPLKSVKADYIFMAQVLLHIRDIDLVLLRLLEMLHTNGHLFIVDFDFNENISPQFVHPGFDQDDLASRMANIGFNSVASHTFYSGENLFMGQDASMFIMAAGK